jgi:hypothetical protein
LLPIRCGLFLAMQHNYSNVSILEIRK